jgi:hypothetical protein
MLPIFPARAASTIASTPSPPPQHTAMPAPMDTSLIIRATTTIPEAPPMSKFFPNCPFKVRCRYCLRDNHDICYRQCPSCYKKRGGTNYFDW